MPLDTGSVRHLHLVSEADRDDGFVAVGQPSVDEGSDIGAALRAARLFRGLTPQDVADATRIRLACIEGIEDLRLEDLPSRPFIIGYVRAYANLLGLDGDAAVSRFKADVPDESEPLRAPVGVRREADPRFGLILICGLLVVGAIGLWNVAQRAMAKDEPRAQVAQATAAAVPASGASVGASAGDGSVPLGAPLPAPVESTTPEPYKTPGLDDAAANGGSADAASAASKARAVALAEAGGFVDVAHIAALGSPFKAKGVIHGAAATDSSGVVLLARKPASLTVRGADGSIYFSRWMAAGESFRAPRTAGLVADVSDPALFDVYTGGVLTGRLTTTQTALAKLVKPAV